jgi:hypothetical protein
MSCWEDADPITSAALLAVAQFGVPASRQLAALESAIEILRAAGDLEAQLEEKGEYIITADTMTKVRDRQNGH